MFTIFLWCLAALSAKIPLPFIRAERLPAMHSHGAVLQPIMYNYRAWFSFLFSIIGQADSHESLALFSIDGA